ncbi:MAG: bifunctional precorrin-2 dehydrogenase/sirohydrochlorin ferrochelatase [Lachnospiraceae bacterium]|nr:bifunctional precorrin-2 dehydrogenase/sirohydrochlorin ferrochelatase [Lachnospiraceae bacterium]
MYFPLFLDLSEKNVLVVGAGQIARRRIRAIFGFAEHITIVAPCITEDFRLSDVVTGVTVKQRCFEENDLEGMDLVIAATDDADLNSHICACCRRKGIPVNVCTGTRDCDFLFPSVIEKGRVVVGVNASGRDHSLVKETRKQIEALLDVDGEDSKYIPDKETRPED